MGLCLGVCQKGSLARWSLSRSHSPGVSNYERGSLSRGLCQGEWVFVQESLFRVVSKNLLSGGLSRAGSLCPGQRFSVQGCLSKGPLSGGSLSWG